MIMEMTSDVSDPLAFLAGLQGRRIPGGCEDCDAYQTVDRVAERITELTVHHDDTCPQFRAMGGGR